MNAVETAFNFYYLYLLRRGVSYASLIGFSSALMTFSKTALYWLIEPFSGFAHTKQNDWRAALLVFIIPNGAWLVMPGLIVIVLGKELARLSKQEVKVKNQWDEEADSKLMSCNARMLSFE